MLVNVRAFVISVLLLAMTGAAHTQEPPVAPVAGPPGAAANRPQFFSGFVNQLSAQSVSVSRKTINKDMVHKVFLIDAHTKVEGKLHVNARVTVRYEATPEGDRAVRIIVR